MLKNLKRNVRGQTGETMTWIVATIVIVIVLTISITFTKLVINKDKVAGSSQDKQKSFLATKSIDSFLENPTNVQLIQNQQYPELETQIRKLLAILPYPPQYSAAGWNFELDQKNTEPIKITNYNVAVNAGQYNYFVDNITLDQTTLKFWLTCQGVCK